MTIYIFIAVLSNTIFLSLNIFFFCILNKRLKYTQLLSDAVTLYEDLDGKNKQLKKENEDIESDNNFKKRIKESRKELFLQFYAKKETKMKDVIDFFISSIEKNNSKNCVYEITHKIVGPDGKTYDRIFISKADLKALKNAAKISTGIVDEYSGYHGIDGRGWELQNVSFSLYRYII